jgi:hypothetical protein
MKNSSLHVILFHSIHNAPFGFFHEKVSGVWFLSNFLVWQSCLMQLLRAVKVMMHIS